MTIVSSRAVRRSFSIPCFCARNMQLHGAQLDNRAKVFNGRSLIVEAYAIWALGPLAYRVHARKLIRKFNHDISPNNHSTMDANASRLPSSFGGASRRAQGSSAQCLDRASQILLSLHDLSLKRYAHQNQTDCRTLGASRFLGQHNRCLGASLSTGVRELRGLYAPCYLIFVDLSARQQACAQLELSREFLQPQ